MITKGRVVTKTTDCLSRNKWTKLSAFLLLLLCLQTSAQVMSQSVTLKGANLKLEKVLGAVKLQTGYSAVGNKEVFTVAKPVTLDVKSMALTPFLELVFRDQPVTYEIVGHNIIISKKNAGVRPVTPPAVYNAKVELSGRILNENNEPVIGATVTTKGGPFGAYSNETGYFSLYADRADVILVVSAVGYQQKEQKTDAAHPFTAVTMKVQVQELSGVVVEQVNTGYQLLNKERATGAFSKPDMEVVKSRTSTMDIMERMEGLVPGMAISAAGSYNTSRYNGSSTRKTIIRGPSSVVNINEPLYVVNGVIVADYSALNLDDIEDITVLKDAAAAAIWGARASNGVIVITTKSGNKLKRLSVNYSGFFNYSGYPNYGKIPMMDSRQYIQAAKETFDPVATPWEYLTYDVITPHDQILYDQYRGIISTEQANKSLDSLANINNGGQIRDIWQRPAFTNNHTVSVAGGNSSYNFYGSLGYTGVNNNNRGSHDNSFKINFTQQVNVANRVNISLVTSLVNRVISGPNMISIGNDFLPYQLFRDEHGNALPMNYLSGYSDSLRLDYQKRSLINLDYYPLDEINKGYNKRNTLFANVTANIAVNIWKGLRFSGAYGYQKAPGTSTSYADHSLFSIRQTAVSLTVAPGGQLPQYNYPMSGGVYMPASYDSRNWTVRNQLIYEAKPRSGKDNLLLQAGQEAQETSSYSNTTTLLGYNESLGSFAAIDWARLQNGIPGTITGYGFLPNAPFFSINEKSRFMAYYGLASYTYNHKYSLDASWRQDYSNQFGSDLAKQNKPVWSIGGKWLISKERFLNPVKWINELGFRATYGITGNSPYAGSTSSFDALRVVTNMNQVGLIAGDALTIGNIANRGLSWEQTQNINLGIDYALLNKRLSGNINLYSRITTDLLGSMPTNPFTGQSSISGNIGKMTNKGIEIAIQSENIRSKDFRWTTGLQFSYNRNELVSYAKLQPWMNTASYRLYGSPLAGYPMNALFAYRFAGLDNMGDPQIYIADNKVSKQPGIAGMDDLKYMGTRQPPYMVGLTNTFAYKNISLSANIVGNFGGVMYRPIVNKFTGRLAERVSFSNDNYSVLFMDRWKKPGDEAFTNIPSFVASSSSYSRRDVAYYTNADINVVSSAYAKLRDVTLNYTLPAKISSALKLQSFNAYLQASNFILWTANKDKVDPSWQAGNPLHSYTLGVNVSF